MSLSPINSWWVFSFENGLSHGQLALGRAFLFQPSRPDIGFFLNHGKVLVVCPPRWYNSKTRGKGGDRSRRNKNPLISGVT